MLTNANYRSRLDVLIEHATKLVTQMADIAEAITDDSTDVLDNSFTSAYQRWYPEAYLVVK